MFVCLDEYELFARPRVAGHYMITTRARKNKHTARMLKNASKDHSTALENKIVLPICVLCERNPPAFTGAKNAKRIVIHLPGDL